MIMSDRTWYVNIVNVFGKFTKLDYHVEQKEYKSIKGVFMPGKGHHPYLK